VHRVLHVVVNRSELRERVWVGRLGVEQLV
jgi:hypothetical protein